MKTPWLYDNKNLVWAKILVRPDGMVMLSITVELERYTEPILDFDLRYTEYDRAVTEYKEFKKKRDNNYK